jgi:hypothetical protein
MRHVIMVGPGYRGADGNRDFFGKKLKLSIPTSALLRRQAMTVVA